MNSLILNCTPLSHFARAKAISALETLLEEFTCYVITEVLEEIDKGTKLFPELDIIRKLTWLNEESLHSPEEMKLFTDYSRVLGTTSERNIGEAATLAWAEFNNAIALIDERAGTHLGKQRGVRVEGSLWFIVEGMKQGILSEMECRTLVDTLAGSHMYLPCDGDSFIQWAHSEGLF